MLFRIRRIQSLVFFDEMRGRWGGWIVERFTYVNSLLFGLDDIVLLRSLCLQKLLLLILSFDNGLVTLLPDVHSDVFAGDCVCQWCRLTSVGIPLVTVVPLDNLIRFLYRFLISNNTTKSAKHLLVNQSASQLSIDRSIDRVLFILFGALNYRHYLWSRR